MRLISWSPYLLDDLTFLIAFQSKKLGLFTHQPVVNDAWFDKDDHNGKGRTFEDGGGFWKLGHKFFKPSRDKVKHKHCEVKNNSLSNVSNVSKYANLRIQ